MPTCLSLETAFDRVMQASLGQWETLVFPRSLSLEGGRLTVPSETFPRRYSLTHHAEGQFCQFLNIPVVSFRSASRSEQDERFNKGIEQLLFPGYRMLALRGRGKEVRALVDELCAPFEHLTLIRCLMPFKRRFQVQWFSLEEQALHLRLIDPATIRQVRADDYLIAGVHIASSEVGARPLTVEPVVFRLKCGNGLIGLGTTASTLSMVPRWNGRDAADAVLEAVEEALVAAMLGIDSMELALRTPIARPAEVINRLSAVRPMPRHFAASAIRALEREDPETHATLYGIMNAVTQVAQHYSPETRLKVESVAGRILPALAA